MRAVDIVRSAVANTFRSRLRTTLTVLAIFIGAFTLTITSAIGAGVSNYIDTQVAAVGESGMITVTKASTATSTDGGPAEYDASSATTTAVGGPNGGGAPGATVSALTDADIATIEALPGVESVEASARISPQYIQAEGSKQFVLSLNAFAGFSKADLAAGAQLSDAADPQILLPDSYVDSLGFADPSAAVGQTLTIGIADYLGAEHTVTATVAGVQNTTLLATGASVNQALSDALVTAQDTGRPATLAASYRSATAQIGTASAAEIDTIKGELADAGYSGQTVADQLGTFQTVVSGIVGVLNAFAVIALLAASFGIINTLLMSVQERTREIGLMKAMGLGGGRIFSLFSLEAVFIGFLGSAIGAAVAAGLGTIVSSVLADGVLSTLPGLQIMTFEPGSILVILLIVMGIAFLAGTLPASRASRQNPIDALRYE
ncbi:ABC transporter permease [Microbacteriaceae bacterium VKM Ac-2855]|nr:ABC transporter permease [Microbacteriaceae bacterium VKM Ac-2855]